jgi:cytochrome b6-f complex iron-sulfur subunit
MATAHVTHTDAGSRAHVEKPSRREFLYYVWGASITLALGGTAAGIAWSGEIVTIAPENLPFIESLLSFPASRFHLAHTDSDELIALSSECTFRRVGVCLVKWVPINYRFECPCCGSKFELNGKYIEDIAPRSLDRFSMTVAFADDTTASTNEAGDPIAINGREIASVTVDTRRLIERPGRT